jgi:hypothetical protein
MALEMLTLLVGQWYGSRDGLLSYPQKVRMHLALGGAHTLNQVAQKKIKGIDSRCPTPLRFASLLPFLSLAPPSHPRTHATAHKYAPTRQIHTYPHTPFPSLPSFW